MTQTAAFHPIHELAPALRSGKLSSSDLVELCLGRIDELDLRLGAFVTVYADQARVAAKAADRAIAAGHDLGPLHGIPIAVKDIIDIEGRITTGGSAAWVDRVSPATATVVQRLLAAGAIIIGKTHTVEFAYGSWGTNEHRGTPRNPWDLDVHRVPGGSSSGSAVATAAGLAAAALGTDTGGSVRLPASFCGLVGLKTTAGRISTRGVLPLSRTLDTVGPLTRSVEDAALVYAALQGPDPKDEDTLAAPVEDPLPSLRLGVHGMRLARLPDRERNGVDAEVLASYDRSLEVLADLGATIVDVPLPRSLASLTQANAVIIDAEGYTELGDVVENDDLPLDRHVRARILAGQAVSARDYLRVLRERAACMEEMRQVLDGIDAVLMPTTRVPAIPVAEVDESVTAAHFTRVGNFLGWCGLALPNGFTSDGLPTSLLINGAAFQESRVLRIGWAFENATRDARRLPEGLA